MCNNVSMTNSQTCSAPVYNACDADGVVLAAGGACKCGNVAIEAQVGDHCTIGSGSNSAVIKKCAGANTAECGASLVDGVCIVESEK